MTEINLSLSRDDRPILIAALFILVILVAGTVYTFARFGSTPLLSPAYLLQQLQIGAKGAALRVCMDQLRVRI